MKNGFSLSLVLLLTLVQMLTAHRSAASSPVDSFGVFDGHADVGEPAKSGSATFDAATQQYAIEGSGSNMWLNRDQFHFAWKRISGDFILTARVQFIGKGVEAHRKLGWIARSTLDTDSPHAVAVVHGDGLTSLQYRRERSGATEQVKSTVTGADVIQLQRKGSAYIMSAARFGEPFATAQVTDLALGDEVYVGLFVCAHNPDVIEKAVFRDVRITKPAKDGFVPYRDYIGSNLEILDVETGTRKVIYQSPLSLQAPNWTRDGKALIYNCKGKLYRFDLGQAKPTEINTGQATNNNNDHVLSFDGKMIAISDHAKEDGNKSNVYVVPVSGGEPRRVTSQGPSYLHSWTPDGKFLFFTGGRNGEFDIYKIPARGGQEQRLTTATGLNDGPESTPDGKYIYFNSNRSGRMQLWRMRQDGSNQEQVTNDEFNNWFPHISPNGKWIVFLSFSQDVDSGDHPFYKHVYIRLMPGGGGSPKVLAYVYGGQGSINVPSWSPDSKRIAFISNTGME